MIIPLFSAKDLKVFKSLWMDQVEFLLSSKLCSNFGIAYYLTGLCNILIVLH